MEEKVKSLVIALGLEDSPANCKIVQEWISRNSVRVFYEFTLDPLLIGKDKKEKWAWGFKKSCLEIGQIAVINCGEIIKEGATLDRKDDLYRPQILVWDLAQKQPIGEPKQ